MDLGSEPDMFTLFSTSLVKHLTPEDGMKKDENDYMVAFKIFRYYIDDAVMKDPKNEGSSQKEGVEGSDEGIWLGEDWQIEENRR